MRFLNITKQYLWIVIFPAAFLLYSNSFNTFPILEQKHSVLAEADSAAFMIPIRDFHLDKKYGDEYNLKNRGLEDVAQKHKIHHTLYVITAGIIYEFFVFIYRFLGISSNQALYSINALLSCLNIGLLYVLLRHFSPNDKRTSLFLIFYSLSLSTWIYGSVPESWTLSATMVLTFLIFLYKKRLNYLILSVIIGIAMLNNIFLGSLFIFLFIDYLLTDKGFLKVSKKIILSCIIAICTWAFFMSVFSLFDDSLRPDNYIKYTLWFKKSIAPHILLFKIHHWEVTITNFLINSILSNQSDPVIPKNAILLTIKESYVGVISTLIYLVLMTVVLINLIRYIRDKKLLGNKEELSEKPFLQFMAYSIIWIFLIIIIDPAGGFMFSTLIVPMMIILINRFTDFNNSYQKVLFYTTLGAVGFNNVIQIMKFREALGAFS